MVLIIGCTCDIGYNGFICYSFRIYVFINEECIYAIKKAQVACEKSGENPANHFAAGSKMVSLGSGSQRRVEDYRMSREDHP